MDRFASNIAHVQKSLCPHLWSVPLQISKSYRVNCLHIWHTFIIRHRDFLALPLVAEGEWRQLKKKPNFCILYYISILREKPSHPVKIPCNTQMNGKSVSLEGRRLAVTRSVTDPDFLRPSSLSSDLLGQWILKRNGT